MQLPWTDAAARLSAAAPDVQVQVPAKRLSLLWEHAEDFWHFERVILTVTLPVLSCSCWTCTQQADGLKRELLQVLWDALDILQGGREDYDAIHGSKNLQSRFISVDAFGRFIQVRVSALLSTDRSYASK